MADRQDVIVPEDEHIRIEGDIIAVEVGAMAKKVFQAHKSLLMTRSAYFKRALQGADSTLNRLRIPEVEVATFDLYVQYIYTGRIPYKTLDSGFGQMADLYFAAGKLEDPGTMNAAIDAILGFYTAQNPESDLLPTAAVIQEVYESTNPGSNIRRLIVDMYLWTADASIIDTEHEDPREFLADCSKAALKQLKAKSGDEGVVGYQTASSCDYHEHDSSVKCNNRKRKREDSDDEAAAEEERDKNPDEEAAEGEESVEDTGDEAAGEEGPEEDSPSKAQTIKKLRKQLQNMQASLDALTSI